MMANCHTSLIFVWLYNFTQLQHGTDPLCRRSLILPPFRTCVLEKLLSAQVLEQRADTIWSREEAFGTVGRAEWKIVQLFIILIVLCLTGYFIIAIVTYDKLADKCIYLHSIWQAVKDTLVQ